MKALRDIGKKNYFSEDTGFERAVADAVIEYGNRAIFEHGRYMLALSGGSTPGVIYELLAKERSNELDWSKTHIFLTDERFVHHSHSDSNFGMIKRQMLDDLKEVHSYPMWRDKCDHEEATTRYKNDLVEIFNLSSGHFPKFDLMVLGLGEDGHVASLFPDEYPAIPKNELVSGFKVAKLDSHRITLTFKVLNNSKKLIFMIRGANKECIIKNLEERIKDLDYPVSRIDFKGTDCEWFINQSYVGKL